MLQERTANISRKGSTLSDTAVEVATNAPEQLYHYTSTIQLPWIVDAGEIRPGTAGRCEFEGLPGLGLVWATANPNGAYSASAFGRTSEYNGRTAYKDGKVWAVRFTLDRAGFQHWPEAVVDDPAWTEDVIKRFNATSQCDNPRDWWTCKGTVERCNWLAIHVRSYTSPWTEITLDLPVHTGTHPKAKVPMKTVAFAGHAFQSWLITDNPSAPQGGAHGAPPVQPARYGWYVMKEQRPGKWVVCE